MINEELLNEIKEYCDLNDEDLDKTINKALRNGFTAIKFGSSPSIIKINKSALEPIKTPNEVIKKQKVSEPILKPITRGKKQNNQSDIYGEE